MHVCIISYYTQIISHFPCSVQKLEYAGIRCKSSWQLEVDSEMIVHGLQHQREILRICVCVCVCMCDRIVNLISSNVKGVFPPNVSIYKHSRIMPDWFNSSDDVFCNIPNTRDVVFLDKVKREVVVLEVACVHDLYMDIAFLDYLLSVWIFPV